METDCGTGSLELRGRIGVSAGIKTTCRQSPAVQAVENVTLTSVTQRICHLNDNHTSSEILYLKFEFHGTGYLP